MVVLGEDGKKGDQPSQVNRPIRTDSAYETASHLTSIDPYVVRNDTPVPQSNSRELEGSDERSPLLPPAYTDDRTQTGNGGRQSPPISGTAKPPSRRVCGPLPSWLRFTTHTLFKLAVGMILLIVVGIIAIPKIIQHGRETGTWPEQPGQPNNPNTPDEPDNSGGGGGGNGGIPWDNNGRAVSWNSSWGNKITFDKLESHPSKCDGFTLPEPISENGYKRLSSTSTYRLPLSAQTLFFHTKSGPIAGKINVLTRSEIGKVGQLVPGLDLGEDKEGEGVVVVQAVFGMGRERDWEGFHVCQAGDGVESAGVFILNEDPWRKPTPGFEIEWNIYLVFPSSHAHSALSLHNLDLTGINMPIEVYPQAGETTRFEQVGFATSNGKIHIPSLSARELYLRSTNAGILVDRVRGGLAQGFIETTNGVISCADCCPSAKDERPKSWNLVTSNSGIAGNFCAKDFIRVRTSTGAVAADFEAPSVDIRTTNGKVVGKYRGIREWLSVGSTNGMMDVEIGFWDDAQDSLVLAGKEKIRHIPIVIETTNSHVDVTLENLPINIEVDAHVETTNGQINFYGHEHFQGEFEATTSSFSHIILENLNKVRQWSVRFAKGYARGTIGEKGGVWGKISLETTNSNIKGAI